MNILFNSRDSADKQPFGPLREGCSCRMRIRIPAELEARRVLLTTEEGFQVDFAHAGWQDDGYELFTAEYPAPAAGLYFYRFHIWDKNGDYDLFRAGSGTNIGNGALWQMSVLPADYAPPEDWRGTVYYQIFPDRFAKSGDCDLTGKLKPYTV